MLNEVAATGTSSPACRAVRRPVLRHAGDRNTVRYNVSVNDRNTTAPYGVISVVCAPATRTLVHHNTVTTNAPDTAVVSSNGPGGVTFRDSVFAGAAVGSPLADARNTYDHNLYDHNHNHYDNNLYARISPCPPPTPARCVVTPGSWPRTTCGCGPDRPLGAPAYRSRAAASGTSTAIPCPTRRTSAPTKDGGSRPNLVVPRPQLGNYLRA